MQIRKLTHCVPLGIAGHKDANLDHHTAPSETVRSPGSGSITVPASQLTPPRDSTASPQVPCTCSCKGLHCCQVSCSHDEVIQRDEVIQCKREVISALHRCGMHAVLWGWCWNIIMHNLRLISRQLLVTNTTPATGGAGSINVYMHCMALLLSTFLAFCCALSHAVQLNSIIEYVKKWVQAVRCLCCSIRQDCMRRF